MLLDPGQHLVGRDYGADRMLLEENLAGVPKLRQLE
jgi:hypothetical protein